MPAALPPIVHHPDYAPPLPPGHRFPMDKFSALARLLEREKLVQPEGFRRPEPASFELVAAVHDPAYVRAVFDAQVPPAVARRIGLPMTEAMARRARAASGGTLLTARLALEHGVACNTAGGSHHAGPLEGAGYCVFNDVAVAARALLDLPEFGGEVRQVLVVDLDVHQGDGTARIFAAEPRVFTLSLHAEKNFPVRKAESDCDVPLPDGLDDAGYLEALAGVLPGALDRVWPDLVFYVAGVDPHEGDRLGRLKLTDAGLKARDAYVLEQVRSRGIPLAGVLGGGYGPDNEVLADRHANLHRAAAAAAARWS